MLGPAISLTLANAMLPQAPAVEAAAPSAQVLTQAAPAPEVPPVTAASVNPKAAPTVDTATPPPPSDPLRGFNRVSYKISQPIDRFVMRPVAIAYLHVVPHPLRDGIHNFLSNLSEPVVFVNDVLQLRFKRALHTAARMAVNTAFGAGGLFDVAKRPYFKLADHPNGFGDTLAYYGVGSGPYLYLPVLGPTNFRDAVGGVGDLLAQPRLLGKMINPDSDKPFFRSSLHLGHIGSAQMVAGGVDERARAEDGLQAIKAGSVDPYATLRSSYMQARAGEIAALKAKGDGNPDAAAKIPALDDTLSDPASAPSSPSIPAPATTPAPPQK